MFVILQTFPQKAPTHLQAVCLSNNIQYSDNLDKI